MALQASNKKAPRSAQRPGGQTLEKDLVETMIANTQTEIKQHQLSEIKRFKTKTYCPVSKLHTLNRALAEIAQETDDYMRNYLTNAYLNKLDLYHVSGRAGSLLPQEAAQ